MTATALITRPILCLLLLCATVRAADPATRPGARRPGQTVQRLREAADALDLTAEQRPGVDEAFAAAQRRFREVLRQRRDLDADARREEFRTIAAGLVDDISAQLTPEQKVAFRDDVARLRGGEEPATRPSGTPRMGATAFPGQTPPPPMMTGGTMAPAPDGDAADDSPPPRSAFLQKLTRPSGLEIGGRVPDALTVVTLADEQKPLIRLLPDHRPLVIVFASLSSPTFRDRLGDLPWLRQQLVGKAELMVVYTREQYPAGQWTVKRNDVDKVSIPPHADLAARLALLRQVESLAKLGNGATLVADAMDDAAADTLAGAEPNCAAVVLRPDGTLAARQQWLDPTGIVGLVEAAGAGGATDSTD